MKLSASELEQLPGWACQHIRSGSLTSDSWLPFWDFLHAIHGGVFWMLVLVYSAAIFLSWLSLLKLKVEGGVGIVELRVNQWAFPTGGYAEFSTIIDYCIHYSYIHKASRANVGQGRKRWMNWFLWINTQWLWTSSSYLNDKQHCYSRIWKGIMFS